MSRKAPNSDPSDSRMVTLAKERDRLKDELVVAEREHKLAEETLSECTLKRTEIQVAYRDVVAAIRLEA
jgi:hypothetical protein